MFVTDLLQNILLSYTLTMNSTKVLIRGHSIVRRLHHFLIDDEVFRYVNDFGINSHAIKYGGSYYWWYLTPQCTFLKRFQPVHIIFMVGSSDVRRLYSPGELACKLLAAVSVLHKRCSVHRFMHVNCFQYLCIHLTIINLSMQSTDTTNLDYASFWEHTGLFASPAAEKYCTHKFF